MVGMNLTPKGSEKKNNSPTNDQVVFFDLGDTLIYFDGDLSKVVQISIKNLFKSLVDA